ncbi:MAG: IS256 family transposase [bacterium]
MKHEQSITSEIGKDSWKAGIWQGLRSRIREAIEKVLDEELCAVLGVARHERSEARRGYRNGRQERTVVTEAGPATLSIPRGRFRAEDGRDREWRSAMLPAYQRRTRRVDEAIWGVYLAGANSRRIRKALAPLLGAAALSKSSISRVVGRLKAAFLAWQEGDLSQEIYRVLYLDALYLSVRLARRVVKAPVQVALGVRPGGEKVVVAIELVLSESTANWIDLVRSLGRRGLPEPILVVADGAPGLLAAIRETWPRARIQRCTNHKLDNLKLKVPRHAHAELVRDYRAITHALSGEHALRAYHRFLEKWRSLCPAAAASLEEAGMELLTFYRFPRSQWKSLRSTNCLERVNEEFRRRVKTQGSFPNEGAALVLLYGLLAFGQIRLRKIDGWKEIGLMEEAALKDVA